MPVREFAGITVVPFTNLLNRPPGGPFHRGGPIWPDVLQRRPAREIAASLVPRAACLTYVDALRETTPGRDESGRMTHTVGFPVLDEARLLAYFADIGLPLTQWDSATYAAATASDFAAWSSREQNKHQPILPLDHPPALRALP